jgi:protocatechuate 3,4-dioxygenase beta subunit
MNKKTLSRRDIIQFGGLALAGTVITALGQGCSNTGFNSAGDTATTNSGATSGGTTSGSTDAEVTSCSDIPTETNGPYPGDGSNSNSDGDKAVNYLTLTGAVRNDVTSSITQSSGYTGSAKASGVPLTVTFKLVNVNNGCRNLAGYAIYMWQCDINGNYSMYSSGVTKETYLRGVQVTDANGEVTFTTVFPGCYDGRIPHIHFEIYKSLAVATKLTNVSKVSQLTFPIATMSEVYSNRSEYSKSLTNYTKNRYATLGYAADGIFSDGYSTQIVSIDSGSYATGYNSSLIVGVKG